jgi:two-component system CheB/CheR fusion protein
MRDTTTTSWRRVSDPAQKPADSRSVRGVQLLPVRILIVDDDIKSSDSLERILHASGYSETRVAYSGHAALAIAEEFQPSVVLLELSLRDMSGYEVARLLRERGQSHDLRLIALTSSREHAGRELARVAGFERYLLKPVAALDLSQLLQMEEDRDPSHPER